MKVTSCQYRRGQCGFTLSELLVVVAIFCLLAILLIPAVTTAQGKGQDETCIDNLHQMGLGMETALQTGHLEYGKDVYPSVWGDTPDGERFTWYSILAEHMGIAYDPQLAGPNAALHRCIARSHKPRVGTSATFRMATIGANLEKVTVLFREAKLCVPVTMYRIRRTSLSSAIPTKMG